MSSSSMMLLLRNASYAVRDREFSKARRFLRQLSSSHNNNNNNNNNNKKKEIDSITIAASSLSAAIDIKQNKPHLASNKFTYLLERYPKLSEDNVFLANLAVVFTHLGDTVRSRIILSLMNHHNEDGSNNNNNTNIWKEQGEVWFRDLNLDTSEDDVVQKKKRRKIKKNDNFRDQEEEMILYLKKELSCCLRVLKKRSSCREQEKETKKQKDFVIQKLTKLRKECNMFQQKKEGTSKAVQHLKERIEKTFTRAICLKQIRKS